jgi:hypothetical protein
VYSHKRSLPYCRTTLEASEVVLRTRKNDLVSLVTINSVVRDGKKFAATLQILVSVVAFTDMIVT